MEEKIDVRTVKVNPTTFWASSYKRTTVEAVIKAWEDFSMLSLLTRQKVVKPKQKTGSKGTPPTTDTVEQSVQVWSLRCDPCYAASTVKAAKLNRSTTATLDSWASELGCTTRKREKWMKHREST